MAPHPDAGTEIKPTMVDVPGGNLEPNEEIAVDGFVEKGLPLSQRNDATYNKFDGVYP
ncbi:hypothetical protein TrRE_jg12419, partial [Triparma retinervis]